MLMRAWHRLFRPLVFVSYGHQDEPWVESLARGLRTAGVDLFFAPWSIKPGYPWLEQVYRALRSCSAGIVVLSPHSAASVPVQGEISALVARAQEEKVPLVPVFYRDVEVPDELRTYQGIDFREGAGSTYEASLQRLVDAVTREPGARWGRMLTLRMLVLLMLVTSFAVTLGAAWLRIHLGSGTFSRLSATQREVQAVDERVSRLTASRTPEEATGAEFVYVSLLAPHWKVVDRRAGGVQHWRYFYRSGRLVARDTIVYRGSIPVEKVREYLDDQQRVFLTDRFDQAGALLKKRHCPHGSTTDCIEYLDDMRSPLPLSPVFPAYR